MLSLTGKVYDKVITDRVQQLTEEKISEEQGVEKILEKRKKLYTAFMDLEKAYDKS